MTRLPFHIVDVFAEKRYAGNPLAVFRAARGLQASEMQQIAREINFSETTFILSNRPKEGGYEVRIFTPKEEVPFAGHPSLGTAYIIRDELLHGRAAQVVLNLKAGQIPVSFAQDGSCWMKQLQPKFGPEHAPAALAAVLSLRTTEIDPRYPVEQVSTGLPFIVVPLQALRALKNAKISHEEYVELIAESEAKAVLAFCPEAHEAQNDISVRVFADYYGVPEDPATGSGNGCLAGYLVRHKYWGKSCIDIRSEQGYEINRPSLLHLRAEQEGENITIHVGGKVTVIARGEFI